MTRRCSRRASPNLKVVAQDAVGYDNIDRAAATAQDPLLNTAELLTDATAEFAFFHDGARRPQAVASEQAVRESTWVTWHPYHHGWATR